MKNIGQAASGKIRLEFKVQNIHRAEERSTITFTKELGSIDPGKTVEVTHDIKITTHNGDLGYENSAVLLEKTDWNESNNRLRTGSILVWNHYNLKKYLSPDLKVKMTCPDASRHVQRTLKFYVEVKNLGNGTSAKTTLRFKCKGKDDKTREIPQLKKGESVKFEFAHKWSTIGTRWCTVTVDPNNKVKESDEENNEAKVKVRIK